MMQKILLLLSVLFGGTGMLFLRFFAKVQEACDKVSDQCADAGFAWEASGKLLLIVAFLNLLALLILYFFRSRKNSVNQGKSPGN